MTKDNATPSESEGNSEESTAPPIVYQPVLYQKELIQHLSSEIDTHKKMIFDWRARAAFYWLMGPFVAFGSVVIITRQVPSFSTLGWPGRVAILFACASFILMGILGAKMEAHMWDQCNRWRKSILLLTTEGASPILKEGEVMEWQRVRTAYLCAHFLLLFALLSTLFLVSSSTVIDPGGAAAKSLLMENERKELELEKLRLELEKMKRDDTAKLSK
jgi:hypothetical protein